jgi:hypothetical protein
VLLREIPGVLAAPVDAFNLMASANKPQGDDWMNGVTWRSEICPAWDGVPRCTPGSDDLPEGGDKIEAALPVTFRTAYSCTTLSERAGAQERAIRQAQAITSHVVARELWTGALTRTDPWFGDPANQPDVLRTNAYLMGGASVVAATGSVQQRLAALEEEARAAVGGQQVMLHVPIRVASTLSDLHRVGNEMRTNANSAVIGDSGYTGQGPLSGTDEVQEVAITGGPTGGTFTLTFDGQTTGPIPYDATPGQLQVSLAALSNLSAGQVAVTGTPGDWTVTFDSELGNVGQLTADASGLTGGVDTAVEVSTTTAGVADTPTAGTWAYATGPVTVRLGQVESFPPVSTHRRNINRVAALALRSFVVTYDTCAVFAVQLVAP